jgi:hypothetical protein
LGWAQDRWADALESLRLQMTAATYERLLLGSRLVNWEPATNRWTVALRSAGARDWLAGPLAPRVAAALARCVAQAPVVAAGTPDAVGSASPGAKVGSAGPPQVIWVDRQAAAGGASRTALRVRAALDGQAREFHPVPREEFDI